MITQYSEELKVYKEAVKKAEKRCLTPGRYVGIEEMEDDGEPFSLYYPS